MSATETYQVDFEPVGKRVQVGVDTSLLEAARQAGIELASSCGGEGNCGQCRVVVTAGQVSPPISSEEFVLTELELQRGERLACCTRVRGRTKVAIPKESLVTNQRLQIAGIGQEVTVDPLIGAYAVTADPPTLDDPRADAERVRDALTAVHGLPPLQSDTAVISQLARQARSYEWRMSAYVRQDELVGVASPEARPVGLAVDLGTTKLAAYLLDLESGEDLAATGAMNPQIGYGEDVISRLVFTHRNQDGGQVMASLIRTTLDEMLGELVAKAGVSRHQVADACLVGNTAMIHLLLQLPVRQLALAPYVAATNAALSIKARHLDLHMAPGAYVYIPPCIGGFVGADHVAMIMTSDLDNSAGVAVGIDIGTNTEIALARPGERFLASVSCASGPAFEGAHIIDGMRAASGAIESVHLDGSAIQLKTIDDMPAVGLCGSGIVDVVAELHRERLLNHRGRFDRDSSRIRNGRHGAEFLLVPAEESGSGREVVVTQEDINEIQLAKGAVRGGLDVLLEVTGTRPEEVGTVLIAGAFGSYLNLENALAMGLLPRFPNAVYRQIGNAAVLGAKRALVSRQDRQRAQAIADHTRYLELTAHPQFRRRFALGMLFPEKTTRAGRTTMNDNL